MAHKYPVTVQFDLSHAVYTAGAIRDQIEKTDDHRVAWVLERGGYADMNNLSEDYICTMWWALEQVTDGLKASGAANNEFLDKENRELMDRLEASRSKLEWCRPQSSGWALRISFVRMGLMTREEMDRREAARAEPEAA